MDDFQKTDRRLTFTLWLTIVISIVLVTTTALLVPATFSAREKADEVAYGNELAACRSEYRVLIDQANSHAFTIILDGLAASADGDREALRELVASVPSIQEEILDATDRYNEAVSLSRQDPGAFLVSCQDLS